MPPASDRTPESERHRKNQDDLTNNRPTQSSSTKIRHNSGKGPSSLSSNGGSRNHAGYIHGDNVSNNHVVPTQNNMTSLSISNHNQPTPLFERLVTEEVQEIKSYARIIENQQHRLVELERVHGDLEARLESESNGRKMLENTLEAREREWANKFEELSKERDHWKEVVQLEQTKNARLIDQVVRKDQDIHRMLQRKYDHENVRGSVRNVRQPATSTDRGERTVTSASKSPEARLYHHKSPHEILAASGSAEKVRVRNVKSLLNDFFGM